VERIVLILSTVERLRVFILSTVERIGLILSTVERIGLILSTVERIRVFFHFFAVTKSPFESQNV
jgi:hypothetical protein